MLSNFWLIYVYIIIHVSANVIVLQYSNSSSLISNNSYTYINEAFTAISSYNDPQQSFMINFDNSTNIYNLSLNQTNIIQMINIY